ncbi:MAG: hypothetical protein JWP81_2324 [Ferruginibacter sp.]|nr:hypothetical protein [Ferruginibacter sp.]
MKPIVSIVLMALLSIAAGLYFPWWSIAVVAFVVAAAIPQSPVKSFVTGFIALFLCWGLLSWYLSSNNNHLLAHKVSVVILKINSAAALVGVTALVGALVAGFAALAGSYVRKA